MADRNFNFEVEIDEIAPDNNYKAVMEGNVAEAARIMEKKMEKFSQPEIQPSIYRVHKKMRDVNEKACEPVALAIGPYHRGKEHLQMMEEYKWRYMKALLVRKRYIPFERYISAIARMEKAMRVCYAEPVDRIPSAEFIEMLVLDGCFIIELLLKYNSEDREDDPIFRTLWIMESLARMLLFENQIPFYVLSSLFDLIDAPNAPNNFNRLISLVLHFFQSYFPGVPPANISSTSHDGKLFGRITRPICLFVKKHWMSSSSQDAKDEHNLLHNYENNQFIYHILDLVHSNWSHKSNNDDDVNTQSEGGFQFIPSATDLRDANVKFRLSSEHNTMFDVVFNKGTLSIPPLIIMDRTESILRSLIVYEQFFPLNRPTNFTAYAWLMDCLINSSADVTLLSQCGIIQSMMGDNEVVAKIFNEIAKSTFYRKPFAYANTFHLINAYSNRKRNRAIANLRRNYLNSPWAYISLFAGLLLLLLTISQTVLSALQLG